jgi:hypothetical protein
MPLEKSLETLHKVCMYTYVHVRVHIDMYVHVQKVHIYDAALQACIHTHLHTYIHIYMHMYMQVVEFKDKHFERVWWRKVHTVDEGLELVYNLPQDKEGLMFKV